MNQIQTKTMKRGKRHLIILIGLLMGLASSANAQYTDAPTLPTAGSATYTTIATAINGWKSTLNPTSNTARTNRSAIIDQVEATLLAAGKNTITDSEYDDLADALAIWLHHVADEATGQNHREGCKIVSIDINENYFGKVSATQDYTNCQCVWELMRSDVLISLYGPMLGGSGRMVLFTQQESSRIYRNGANCNVMFSTNGENCKLLILGRRNHSISLDGGQNWSDPSSYTDVVNRTTTTARGQEVVINSGALMTAYTTFTNNASSYLKGVYKHYTTNTSGTEVKNIDGGAISILGTLKACAFYNTTIKNNHLGLGSADATPTANFGGGLSIRSVTGAEAMTEGVWFNQCTIMGNVSQYGHGGGVALYIDGGDGSTNDKVVFRDTDFKYNCQVSNAEKHGGGIWHRDTKRKCQIYNSNFIENYAHGLTAGGGGVSTEGHMELEGCTFDGNVADNSFGGGLYARPYTGDYVLSVSVKGCEFKNNQCTRTSDLGNTNCELDRGSGGGIMIALVTAHDCTANLTIDGTSSFTDNHADRNGGAIAMSVSSTVEPALDAGTYTVDANLELKKVTISGNTAGKSGVSWTPAGSRYGYGGAIYLSYFNLKVTGSNANVQAYNNSAIEYGGTVGVYKGNVTMDGGTFGITGKPNSAPYGGGFYVNHGTVNFNNGIIACNTASQSGGGVYVENGSFNMKNGSIGGTVSTDGNSATAGDGGGVYVATGGICTIKGGTIGYNTATSGNGGGFYVNPGAGQTTTINSDEANTSISNNIAKNGGGAFINTGILSVSSTNSKTTQILSNTASVSGGGVYVNGTAGLTSVNLDSNTATSGNGGGIYATGAVTATGGTISTNHADSGDGGGIYALAGSNTIKIESSAQVNTNTAINGAGIYAASGTVTIQTGATLTSNVASGDGGGIYANGGTVNVSASSNATKILYQNQATNGGGIYANGGTVNFSNGTIEGNYATQCGGGLYIPAHGTLKLMGTATLTGNRVPLGCLGGGVYLEGTVQAGNSSSDAITVADNYADAAGATVTSVNRNNIYLPNPLDTQTTDVITVVNNGLDLNNSSIGFSVPGNYVPVIYCATSSYLSPTIMGSDAIFEDSERFSKYYSTTSPYKANYIYLYSDTWVSAVDALSDVPEGGFVVDADGNVTIGNEEGLAWLISYVNGLNSVTGGAHDMSDKKVTLDADLDMSAYSWVPITPFKGEFDGNGHVIKGIYCSYMGGTGGTGTGLGLFATADGAAIHDVFLSGERLLVKNQTSGTYSMGAIANELKGNGSVYNCIASATMESTFASTTMGGLVGKLTAGTIHSSAAMPDMTGYTMGGLAGSNAGNIYNSFANPKFTYSGTANACFVGGLVAENSGTVQNCYVRFSRPSTFANAAKFGQLVGKTAASKVTVCYHPTTYANGIPSALVNDGSVSSTIYGDVVAPYLYNHSNDNLVGSTNVTLCNQLNAWVSTNNSTSGRPTCAQWKRTTAGGYVTNNGTVTGGDINGDYPIHEISGYTCAASTDGVNLDYAASLDAMLTRHAANATVNLYANDETSGETGNNVVVYIDEDISLLQSDATNQIEAYTCQTLKSYTRGERWHYISSSLTHSGTGIDYTNSTPAQFNWSPNPCNVSLSANDEAALFPSDITDITKVDLYSFYEPEYHWINLKRRSDSHWHMNAHDVPIAYNGNGTGGNGNEEYLIPGKGYLASIDQEQLLQNQGTLNNGTVTLRDVTKSDYNEWAGLLGYHLLGNPYQSYLDVAQFISTNNAALWGAAKDDPSVATYAVYDPQTDCYLQYKSGSSRGARVASGYLNPHQGFLVRKTTANSVSTTVTFTNDMRSNSGTPNFRGGEQPVNPVVNLMLTDAEGHNDIAVLEVGRDADEGVEKLRVGSSTGRISLALGDESFGVLFRSKVDNYQPLRFVADEEGEFTLTWETANAVFDTLMLVDNITGATTDMRSRSSYTFQGSPDQYASRFKILIGGWKIVDDEPEPTDEPFVFVMGDEIVVSGEGTLQMFDVTGRLLMQVEASGMRTTIRKPRVSTGVYVLRLTGNDETKTQKIVID